MGQPDHGQPGQGQHAQGQFSAGHVPEGSFAPGPGRGPMEPWPPRRSRPGIWIALGCAVLVILLLLIAVTGGVIYLVTRGGQDETTAPETAQYSGEHFSVQYPATWFSSEITADESEYGMVLEVADEEIPDDAYDEFATNSVVVYVFDADLHALKECESQSGFVGYGWDDPGPPETIESATLDGREVPGYRATGEHAGQEAVAEMYCADVGDLVLQVAVETHGSTELSPEVRTILDSWTWTDAA